MVSCFLGNMTPYMTSYMKRHNVDVSLNYAESTWISAIAAMGQGMSMFLGGIMYRTLGPKLSTLIGAWLARYAKVFKVVIWNALQY